MPQLKDLNIRLTGNNKDFTSKMQKAEKSLKKFGQSMANIGKKMSMALTLPIVGLAVKSAQAFDTQELAVQKLSAQIKQSGQDIESVLPKYKKFAADLQNITTVGDEATLGLMQMAMTMGSDAPDIAAQNAIALSKALGVDLNSAIKMVTLAEKGEFTMLNRYVPALRATENEAEKLAITTQLYADGLAIAKAEALNGLGPLKQLKNTFGDLLEEIGSLIVENDTFKISGNDTPNKKNYCNNSSGSRGHWSFNSNNRSTNNGNGILGSKPGGLGNCRNCNRNRSSNCCISKTFKEARRL